MKRKKAPPLGISKPKSRPKKYGGKLQPILKALKLGTLSSNAKEGPQKAGLLLLWGKNRYL
jgi:hypothetical protein